VSEWVGYVELEGAAGVWLWAAEAGRATRPPRQSTDAGLQQLRTVLGQDPRHEPGAVWCDPNWGAGRCRRRGAAPGSMSGTEQAKAELFRLAWEYIRG